MVEFLHNVASFSFDYVIIFLVVMSLLVFVHEWGHYWIGQKCGVHAEVFSIGFGPEIWGWTSPKTGTRWRISALPLGGYVKFLGDANAASAGAADDGIPAERRAHAFHTAKLWKRALIVAGGPAANIVFAILLMAVMLIVYGQPYTPPTVVVPGDQSPAARAGLRTGDVIVSLGARRTDSFEEILSTAQINPGIQLPVVYRRDGRDYATLVTPEPIDYKDRFDNVHRIGDLGVATLGALSYVGRVTAGSAAEKAGFQTGDRVVAIDGKPVSYFSQIPELVRDRANQPTVVAVERGGARIELHAIPMPIETRLADGTVRIDGRLGFTNNSQSVVRRFNVGQAAVESVDQVWHMTGTIYTVVKQIVLGLRPAKEIGGPLRIAKTAGEVSQLGLSAILFLVIGLSVTLGVFNLLPVPMLDGGHLLFYAIEAVKGSPLSAKAQEYGFRLGLYMVLGLTVFATFNDLVFEIKVLDIVGGLVK